MPGIVALDGTTYTTMGGYLYSSFPDISGSTERGYRTALVGVVDSVRSRRLLTSLLPMKGKRKKKKNPWL